MFFVMDGSKRYMYEARGALASKCRSNASERCVERGGSGRFDFSFVRISVFVCNSFISSPCLLSLCGAVILTTLLLVRFTPHCKQNKKMHLSRSIRLTLFFWNERSKRVNKNSGSKFTI